VIHLDYDKCVECGVCERVHVCAANAITKEPDLPWPRILRREFSDPVTPRWGADGSDMKANDVKNKIKKGEAEFSLEFGRPGVSVLVSEIEEIIAPIARLNVHFPERGHLTSLMSDTTKGIFKDEVRNERLLRASIGFTVEPTRIPEVMKAVEESATLATGTIFSLDLVTVLEDDGSIPNVEILNNSGYHASPNCKINLGLGRINDQEKEML
jgi:ferredoxin